MPGQSGNPGGRSKKREDLKAQCIKAVDDHVIEAWINEVKTMGDDWVECSKLLAGYGYGKPTQRLEGNLGLTLEQLVAGIDEAK